ncbi:hypothetical protein FRB93_011157 [Tulasnella sp. JGI-2019a]|nr:hypothetical protein FRB93_011157 [Tulasnella sp. JGI-2019a]
MTSNTIGRGQRRRTFDFDQEDSLLPIKRKATSSLEPLQQQAQKLELELSTSCSLSGSDVEDGMSQTQHAPSPPPSESTSSYPASSSTSPAPSDMMDIDPGPSNRATSRRSNKATRYGENADDISLESSPHVRHESWANLATGSLSPKPGHIDKVSSGSHYPTIDLTQDSFSHLEVCEFNRALKRSRLQDEDSDKPRQSSATGRGGVSNPASTTRSPSPGNTRRSHSTLELKREVFLQDLARPPLISLKHTRHRRFQPAISSARRRSWTTKLKPRASSVPAELPSSTLSKDQSSVFNPRPVFLMTPTTPTTPTHTLPPIGSENNGTGRSGRKNDVQDTPMEMMPTNSGVGLGSSSSPSSAPTSDDDDAVPLRTRRSHGHPRRHLQHRHAQQTTTAFVAPPVLSTPTITRSFSSSINLHLAISSPYASSSSSPSSIQPSSSGPSLAPSPPIIPPTYPLITRETLKELELDVTLRSPQLRHDILFDPGLQFRPTTGRRKREASDRYWEAVAREMQWGCVCTSFDKEQKIHPCICGKVPEGGTLPSSASDIPVHHSWHPYVLSTPSRVLPLLETLKEVLHLVVHPASMTAVTSNVSAVSGSAPSSPTGASPPPEACPPSSPVFAVSPPFGSRSSPANADPLLAPFDPALIQQELTHGVFDHQSVFKWVGQMMKMHCAPMRDGMVENMVRMATETDELDPTPERRPVKALKMCFDILEVMKLDIANHQLQSLRPYLLDTSADFEMKTFQERYEKRVTGLDNTRRWISRAFASINPPPASPPVRVDRSKIVSAALCSAMVELVFQPPAPPASRPPMAASSSEMTVLVEPVVSQNGSAVTTSSPIPDRFMRNHAQPLHPCEVGFPETLYLDHARLASYINDASDLLGLYMLIMLFRQLTTTGSPGAASVALEDWEIDRIKREVWEVGPSRLGLCFDVGPQLSSHGTDPKIKWEKGMSDVTLQVAKRAEEARERITKAQSHPNHESPIESSTPTDRIPSPWMLTVIEKWKAAHYKKDSPLQKILQRRLQSAVLDVVKDSVLAATSATSLVDASPGGKSPSARAYSAMPMRRINRHPLTATATSSPSTAAATILKKNAGSGLEPLMPEILHLGERIARLVLFHSRVYKRLYEVDGFIDPTL